jgi:hypothetical protein
MCLSGCTRAGYGVETREGAVKVVRFNLKVKVAILSEVQAVPLHGLSHFGIHAIPAGQKPFPSLPSLQKSWLRFFSVSAWISS